MTDEPLIMLLEASLALPIQSGLFLILNILDAHSTWLVLKPDNYHRERNLIARWFFRKVRIPAAIILFKSLLMSILGLIVINWRSEVLTINLGLFIGNLIFIWVVIHNYRVSRRYKKRHKRKRIYKNQ